MRINKFIAHTTGLSRREVDNAITAGRVCVGGVPAVMGAQVEPQDQVTLDGKIVGQKQQYTYLAINKPIGYLCSRRSQGGVPTIYELLPPKHRLLKAVGRLDKDSSGLLLLSDDGDFAHSMTHPKYYKTKIYEVELDQPLAPLHQQMISDHGLTLEDGVSKFLIEKLERRTESVERREPQEASKRVTRKWGAPTETRSSRVEDGANSVAGPAPSELRSESETGANDASGTKINSYRVTMHEGRNRQIRRTFAALGYTVTKLHRTNFGPYALGDISSGNWSIVDIH